MGLWVIRKAALFLPLILFFGGCGDPSDGSDSSTPEDCFEILEDAGVSFTVGPQTEGIPEPVTVELPLLGLSLRYEGSGELRQKLVSDCSLAAALVKSIPIQRAFGVVEIGDLGIYNYRCIGGGTPPDCPNGISQHAYGRAIDLATVTTADGSTFSIVDHWRKGGGQTTCGSNVTGTANQFLHDWICAQKEANIWNIVLTPNYNSAHYNHIHADLTPDADYIQAVPGPMIDAGPDFH